MKNKDQMINQLKDEVEVLKDKLSQNNKDLNSLYNYYDMAIKYQRSYYKDLMSKDKFIHTLEYLSEIELNNLLFHLLNERVFSKTDHNEVDIEIYQNIKNKILEKNFSINSEVYKKLKQGSDHPIVLKDMIKYAPKNIIKRFTNDNVINYQKYEIIMGIAALGTIVGIGTLLTMLYSVGESLYYQDFIHFKIWTLWSSPLFFIPFALLYVISFYSNKKLIKDLKLEKLFKLSLKKIEMTESDEIFLKALDESLSKKN